MALADRHERREPPSAAAQPSGGPLSARDPERPSGDVCAAIAATLRYVTGWSMTYDNDGQTVHAVDVHDLRYTADQLDAAGAATDCCPVCEEVGCDDDCPLAPYRNTR